MIDELPHYRSLVDGVLTMPLCVTWVEGLSVEEALLRVGRREDGMAERTFAQTVRAAYDAMPTYAGAALVGRLGKWVALIEPNGFQGSRLSVLSELSRKGRALSVFWNVNSEAQIAYAECGRVLANFDPFTLEDLEDLPVALSAWQDLAFEDDVRVAGLALGETFSDQRLDEEWLSAEHLSAILDPPTDTTGEELTDEEVVDQRAFLAGDPKVAAIVADPSPARLREIAVLVAETACTACGLSDPLVERAFTALSEPDPAVFVGLRSELSRLQEELSRRGTAAREAGMTSPSAEQLHHQYLAAGVLTAALDQDPFSAAMSAIWQIGVIRLDDMGSRRVGALWSSFTEIEKQILESS
ncbi:MULTISPECIES: DUF6461 domain-containing protein [Streptosporangium]|uniref:DUF4192 domain-containing protein n=1 Tax=Streptosporangium brasiliense TaxID=47480 RepID=A0ABT9RN01_9ACTN|nr:DUF6461 domain-containing protein [Streptosporangium brasiliense]MDP9870217.1 hypothetical protein [Streptosporangium brasiliense]